VREYGALAVGVGDEVEAEVCLGRLLLAASAGEDLFFFFLGGRTAKRARERRGERGGGREGGERERSVRRKRERQKEKRNPKIERKRKKESPKEREREPRILTEVAAPGSSTTTRCLSRPRATSSGGSPHSRAHSCMTVRQ
jgi:hypothetical protein